MAMLVWGDTGSHLYETGVDRGVLYTPNANVPWNGLTAVNEAPTGGDPQPYYLDGVKYLQIPSSEEFVATIEAFSAPAEFGVCDGTAAIYNGLFVTQQPRQQFGFSYRSLIGNDLDAEKHGYKIHIVYNCLAKPSNRNNSTMSDSVDPMGLSWEFETVPYSLAGFKPSAHFIIDTTVTDESVIRRIEGLLYGTEYSDPTLPTPAQLAAIFAGGLTNVLTNPTFQTVTSDTSVLRTNYIPNGDFEVGAAGWLDNGSAGVACTQTTEQVHSGSYALKVAIPGGYTGQGTVAKTPNGTVSDYIGENFVVSLWVYVPIGTVLWITAVTTGTGASTGYISFTGTGDWHYISLPTSVVGSDGNVGVNTWVVAGSPPPTVYYIDDVMIEITEKAPVEGDTFSGSTPATDDFVYAYTGTVGNSPSTQSGFNVASFSANLFDTATVTRSSFWSSDGNYSAMIAPISGQDAFNGGDLVHPGDGTLTEGTFYTIIATCHVDADNATPSTSPQARAILLGEEGPIQILAQAPNVVGDHILRATFTATADTDLALGGDTANIWWDNLTIVEGEYSGAAFNGDSPGAVWDGVPHASTSHLVGKYD